jgi:hypothetical protein
MTHYCIDHLEHHREQMTETHGLDCGPYETWTDEWDSCKICGDRFDDFDLIQMAKEADERAEREACEEDGPDYLSMYKESING